MRDDDELGLVGVAAEQLDEAADVGVVERGLDLVEEVERARLRQEEANRNEIAPSAFSPPESIPSRVIFLPAGRSSTSTPVSPPSSSGSTSRSRPSPPGKSVAATSSKCSATAWNVSAKRRSTVSRELVAQVG